MDEINLLNKDGQILVSSREIAERFGKKHSEVIYAIEGREAWDETKEKKVVKHTGLLMGGHDQLLKMFIKSEYIDARGRTQYEYLMNRDGFSLLVMGFGGKKALEWKLKYIDAFNKMEETIKSGNYLSEEEKLKLQLFSKDPSEVAYAHNRLVEIETAPLRANIETLSTENQHKQEIINGLTDEISIYEKPDIINRICRKSCGGYADRYKELYKCFKENYHTDLIIKCRNYNGKQKKKKDQLSVIRYAENFGYIDDLYDCCVKLYETEVKQIIKELSEVQYPREEKE